MNSQKLLWSPSESFVNETHISKYKNWLQNERGLTFKEGDAFDNYNELWQWSVDNHKDFWASLMDYFDVQYGGGWQGVVNQETMPGVKWFEGCRLNYAEHLFKGENDQNPAIIFGDESGTYEEWSWRRVREEVTAMASHLKSIGVGEGDRVVAFVPNIPQATIAFMAVNSIGAIWSSCSPDFGADSVVDRFAQIEAKVLFAVGSYRYGDKIYDVRDVILDVMNKLDTLEECIFIDHLDEGKAVNHQTRVTAWEDCLRSDAFPVLEFNRVDFNHPIWVLYSSGTTGIPKAITHSHGGVLLEHLKYLAFHNDVHPGERFFWFSTTGWMMWNFIQASMLMGATIVLYDGSPGYPDINTLWRFAEKARITHFGTSAPFLIACMKKGISPKNDFDLSSMRSIGSTGSPLPPEAFDWTYENISKDIWLCSMAGGTDVCTAFVGGNPTLPLYLGEIQCRALGCALYAVNEEGERVHGEVGEMIIEKPMPSMPVFFSFE